MKYLSIIIFLSFTTQAKAACVIDEGIFNYESGSEYLITLFLEEKGKFSIHHEHRNPGYADEAVLDEYSGKWQCEGNRFIFTYLGHELHAIYKPVGKNPIGRNPNMSALHFESSDDLLGSLVLTKVRL